MALDPLANPLAEARKALRDEAPTRRVALVFGSFKSGGVARVMLLAAHELIARNFAADLVVGRTDGTLRSEVPERATVVELARAAKLKAWSQIVIADPGIFLPLAGGMLVAHKASGKLRSLPSLVDYFGSRRPDAVLAATAPFNLIALFARRIAHLDARVVVSEHNQLSSETVGDRQWRYDCPPAMLLRSYLRADAIVAVSDGVAAEMTKHAGLPTDRITTVYNPVAGARLLEKAQAYVNHPWFAPGQPPVLLAAGKLKPQKDLPTLIRAFARVRSRRPVRLAILGSARGPGKDAAYLAALRELPVQLGVAGDVSFVGFTDNPFAYMSRAAVFVLSSAWEGLPTVLIEALACGCPVVSTDCPSGPAEILDYGRYGPLVPVGDDAALAAAISRVLDAPPPRDELTGRAASFTVERAVDRYLELMFGATSPNLISIAAGGSPAWRNDLRSTGKPIAKRH
jgi:glycosyltransferase involved in cell wall biosynthesis